MKCPYCGKDDTRVIDSRPVEENNSIRRRRVCDSCKRRFTTYEKIETIPLVVIKKDNIREPYDRSKIEGGILRACHKRPVSVNQIKHAVDEIEVEIFNREEKEISSGEIGELVMSKIHELDPVAYVRFASVYREFKDVETFMDELKNVLRTENRKKTTTRRKK
ncbi:MAG: transcriptional repressor NrdR [Lachnospiraceae bacterium]|nr:transcriptional repressor NrdR [Lachnospiraceae bacterium]